MPKIRVMIVEDSHVVREFLKFLIAADPRLEVAVAVESAEEAVRLVHQISPDVISMDIRLPGMNGFEATQQIMREKPTPIVVVSASVEAEDLQISMNAMRAGALSVVEKPVGMAHRDYELMASRLCTQLVLMSQVKLIRQRLSRHARVLTAKPVEVNSPLRTPRSLSDAYKIVAMVASTGGPAALQRVLSDLPPNFPLPILLVQHIAAGFLDGFVSWLNTVSPLRVSIAKDGEIPAASKVYLPPGDCHLCLTQGRLRYDKGELVSSQRPSGNVLFRSLANDIGDRALAVLLTGMGDDGAEGLKAIRQAGGYTIAEDESTAVVYGMPAVAVRLGAVCESLPLLEIGGRLRELVSEGKEAKP